MIYLLILFFLISIIFGLLYGELFLKLFSIGWEKVRSLYRSRREMSE